MAYGFDHAGRTPRHPKWLLWGSEHWLRVAAWTLVLVIHSLFFYTLLRPADAWHSHYPASAGQVLMVRLIPAQQPVSPKPVPFPVAPQVQAQTIPPVSSRVSQRKTTPLASKAEPILKLYAPNGSLYLPEKAWQSAPRMPAFRAHLPQGNRLLHNRQLIGYHSTVFSTSWAPGNVSLLNQWLGDYVRKTTQKITLPVQLPGNTHFTCYILLFPPSGGCGFVRPKQTSSFHRPKNADTIQQLPSLLLVPSNPLPAPVASVAPNGG